MISPRLQSLCESFKNKHFPFTLCRRPQHGRIKKCVTHVFCYVGVIGKVAHKKDFIFKLSQYDISLLENISDTFLKKIIFLLNLADGLNMAAQKKWVKTRFRPARLCWCHRQSEQKNDFLLHLSGYDINTDDIIA